MTPEEAREIDRLEFEADCRAARERAYSHAKQCRSVERARIQPWLSRSAPAASFKPALPTRPPMLKVERKRSGVTPNLYAAGGLAMTLNQWAQHLGISLNTLHQRMHRSGSLEAAVALGGPKPRGHPKKPPGVVMNFPPDKGTGGGSVAQDIPQIEFFT